MKQKLVFNVLNEFFSEECDAVGESNLNNIVSGYSQELVAQKGAFFDFSAAISVLASAVTIIGVIYDYLKRKKEKKENPSFDEVKSQYINKVDVHLTGPLSENVQIKIYQAVQQNINDESPKEG